MHHESVPDEQYDHRAKRPANETGPLIEPVPSDGLPDERRKEGAGDTEQRRQDETRRLVWARRQEASDDAGDEADHDNPDDVRHDKLPRVRSFDDA